MSANGTKGNETPRTSKCGPAGRPCRCLFSGLLAFLKDALFDELLRSRTALQLLIEAIGFHMFLQALLVGLNAGRSIALRQNVACV